jgi:hypothetical protein
MKRCASVTDDAKLASLTGLCLLAPPGTGFSRRLFDDREGLSSRGKALW